MGHGDTLVLADANFPAHSIARANQARLVPYEACTSIADLLAAILTLLPLDTYDTPAACMEMVASDAAAGMQIPCRAVYESVCSAAEQRPIALAKVERFAFYEQARSAFAIVPTSDAAPYANVILRKGVLPFQK